MRKKAFVLTLDVTIALILVVTILLISNYYIAKAKSPSLSKLQLTKRGSDVLLQLDYLNVLDKLNPNTIHDNMTGLLPPSYDMQLNFTSPQFQSFIVGNPVLPAKSQIGSGRMIFVLDDDRKAIGYYTVRYYIWLR